MMTSKTKNLFMLFLGLCLGAFIGIVSAPTAGSVARNGIVYNLKSYRKKLYAFIVKLIGSKNEITSQAKDTGQEVIADVIHAAEKILKDLDLLTEELSQADNNG